MSSSIISETIALPPVFSITHEALMERDEIALRSAGITAITDAAQNNAAREVAVEIRRYVKAVEANRTSLTKPLLDAQKTMKGLADQHVAPLGQELVRLESLAADWLAADQRRVAREEAARQEAYQKAETERRAAEQAALAAAAAIITESQLDAALKVEQVAIAAEATVQQIIQAPVPRLDKASGQSLKKVLRYEVTDIRALAAARPDLVRIEPNCAGIQATCIPEMPVPGLKLWWEMKATFSSR